MQFKKITDLPHAIETGTDFISNWKKNAELLNKQGLYSQNDEHSSCGVGLIAALNGEPRRDVVEAAARAHVGPVLRRLCEHDPRRLQGHQVLLARLDAVPDDHVPVLGRGHRPE